MPPANFLPYLTVVVTCRNDFHRSDLKQRLLTVIQQWNILCQKWKLSTEYIIVEWNPPAENTSLYELLKEISTHPFFKIRIISVPNSFHLKIDPQNTLPLHQMIAKNVGIRRANGKFILCTNMDIFPDELLIQHLANHTLLSRYFYRTNRCDIPDSVLSIPEEKIQPFARQHIIRRMGMNHRWPGLKVHKKQYFIYRYSAFNPFYPILLVIKKWILGKEKFKIASIDKEASGDFTLMSKEDWLKIDGYMELPIYPLHIDSLALIKAYLSGIKQYIFDEKRCVYHIDHPGSWREEIASSLQIKHPHYSWTDVEKIIQQMKSGSMIYNKPNWGLANEILPEQWI